MAAVRIHHEFVSGTAEGHQVDQFLTCFLVMQRLPCTEPVQVSAMPVFAARPSSSFQSTSTCGPTHGACAHAAGRRVLRRSDAAREGCGRSRRPAAHARAALCGRPLPRCAGVQGLGVLMVGMLLGLGLAHQKTMGRMQGPGSYMSGCTPDCLDAKCHRGHCRHHGACARILEAMMEQVHAAMRWPILVAEANLGGRVQVHYLEEPAPDYVRAAVTAAAELHATGLPGDILIFLTGACPPSLTAQGLLSCMPCW